MMMACKQALTMLTFMAATTTATTVCGNYCGGDWCSGSAQEECDQISGSGCTKKGCDESGPTDGSCADQCCKLHDACCGSSDRTQCNRAIVSCLDACPQGPGSPGQACYNGVFPVAVSAIKAAMATVEDGCCGTSCNEGQSTNASATLVV